MALRSSLDLLARGALPLCGLLQCLFQECAAVRLVLAGVSNKGNGIKRHRQFHTVNVREIPVSGGVKGGRFVVADPAATRAFEPGVVEGFGAERIAFMTSVIGCRFHFGHWFGVGWRRQRCGCGNGKGPRERTLGGVGWMDEESFPARFFL